MSNTLVVSKEEQEMERRDALLDEFRRLADEYPDDPMVRKALEVIDRTVDNENPTRS